MVNSLTVFMIIGASLSMSHIGKFAVYFLFVCLSMGQILTHTRASFRKLSKWRGAKVEFGKVRGVTMPTNCLQNGGRAGLATYKLRVLFTT